MKKIKNLTTIGGGGGNTQTLNLSNGNYLQKFRWGHLRRKKRKFHSDRHFSDEH